MANTPMVILWPNTDGSITLSQRQASSEVMPTVVSNPPRTATLEQSLSSTSGSNPKVVFSIPSDGTEKTGKSTIIWTFGTTNPGSSAVDATLTQHLESGPTQIDLSQALTSDSKDPTNPISTIAQSTTSSSGSAPSASTSGDQVFSGIPLLPYQKYIIAHAILSMLGFLVFLPLGAIVARWLRTFTSIWFTAHWVIQFGVGEFHSYLTSALCSPPNYGILPLRCQPVACGVWPHPLAFPTIPYHFNLSLRRHFFVQLYHHLHC